MTKSLMPRFLSLLSLLSLSACSVFGVRSGYEHVPYTVIDAVSEVEIRHYKERLAAEVQGAASDDEAFRILFKYISGENTSSSTVAMTVPVEVQVGNKISMTVPVEVAAPGSTETGMRFFLPSSFTRETAPKPRDSRVTLVSLPEATFAVLRYSGLGGETDFAEKRSRLLSMIEGSKWVPVGQARFLGYDPPFTIPFLRRNEVLIEVHPAA